MSGYSPEGPTYAFAELTFILPHPPPLQAQCLRSNTHTHTYTHFLPTSVCLHLSFPPSLPYNGEREGGGEGGREKVREGVSE